MGSTAARWLWFGGLWAASAAAAALAAYALRWVVRGEGADRGLRGPCRQFRRTARDIDSATAVPGSGVRLDLLLTGLLLLGAVLFGYLLYTVLRRF